MRLEGGYCSKDILGSQQGGTFAPFLQRYIELKGTSGLWFSSSLNEKDYFVISENAWEIGGSSFSQSYCLLLSYSSCLFFL